MKRLASFLNQVEVIRGRAATLPPVCSSVSRRRLNGTEEERARLRQELLSLFVTFREEGLAPSTLLTYGSALRFWNEFCELVGINTTTFGQPPEDGSDVPRAQVRTEDSAFMLFLVYVVNYPRQAAKVKLAGTPEGLNTASYAEGLLAAVRSHYGRAYDRRPGTTGGDRSYQLKLLVKALHKFSPSRRALRLPILAHHLRAIRRLLDLENNPRDRVLWALITASWQSVSRFSDLIRGKKVKSRASWDSTDMHRGRVSGESDEAAPAGYSVRLDMPPSKTDQSGEKGFVKFLPVDNDPDSISAGAAIFHMLDRDERSGPDASVPLFRDPTTDKQMTYRFAVAALKALLERAGFPELASGWHSLRIGGATTAANLSTGVIAGFMGCWSSDAKYGYFWAMRGRIKNVSIQMGRAPPDEATHRHSLARR